MYATQIQKVKLNHNEFEILYKLTQIANNMANVTLYSIRQTFLILVNIFLIIAIITYVKKMKTINY